MKHRKLECVVCEIPLVEGTNWRRTAIGRKCTQCISDNRKQWYEDNKQRIQTQAYQFRRENPELVMYQRIKTKAKKEGIPFDLELEDILIPDKCPIFNVPFVFGKKSPHNASLDRVDPTKGYVKGNVVVISYRANSIKNDATPKELRLVADYVDLLLITRYD